LSAVSATVTTLLIGALSDKMGKRKLFIAGGYIAWGISILAFSLLRIDVLSFLFPYASATTLSVTLTIILDCVMTFFGSSANDAAFNAYLTDSTDSTNRGSVEGVNAMMPLVAILVVFGSFMFFDLEKSSSWTIIFIIIGLVVTTIGILGLFLIEDTVKKAEDNNNYFKNIIYGFRPKVIKDNKFLYLFLIAFAIFGISIQIFMPYLIIYYEETLKMDNYVLIMAPAIILASIATFFYGKVYDKLGFIKSVIFPILSLILGYVILYFFENTVLVFIGSLLMMTGYLTGMAVFGAVIRDYTPIGKAGMFQGLRIVGQVLIPGLIGPFIGSAVLKNAVKILNSDGTTSFLPNQNIFLAALVVAVVLSAILVLISFLLKKKNNNVLKQDTEPVSE